jgi:hypothetical protein
VKEKTMLAVSRALCVVISTLVPPISILVLYYVHTTPARLGTIAAFSFIVATVIAVFTAAKPVDIFAATAA